MAFPILHRLLFGNDGAGPKLRSDILPDNALVSDAQTLTDAQKTQVQTNLGVTAGSDTVTLSTAQTIAGAKTFSSAVTVNNALTASSTIKGQRFTADNGVNTSIDFLDSHGAGGWFLSHDHKGDNTDWHEIMTSNYGTFSVAVKAPSFQATSDRRLKEGLTKKHYDLSSLSAYRYVLKDDGKTHVGLVAQEVEKVIPEAVSAGKDGFLALDYNAVVAALVDEVNRLKARVAELEK